MTTRPRLVRIVEYGEAQPIRLLPAEITELEEAALVWQRRLGLRQVPLVLSRSPTSAGDARIAARDVAGVVRVGSIELEVVPKFLESDADTDWRAALLNVLGTLGEFSDDYDDTATAHTLSVSLADLFGYVIVRALDTAAASGLPRAYVERSQSLPYLRGRLNTSDAVALVSRSDLVPCVYDELAIDTPVNRLLKWALLHLHPELVTSALRMRVEEWLSLLGEASTRETSSLQGEHYALSLQHLSLAPAVRVARMLLDGRGLHHAGNSDEAPGFLWRSATVFEAFVDVLVRRVCRNLPGHRFADSPIEMARPTPTSALPSPDFRRGTVALTSEPDQRIQRSGVDVLVLDTKYKVWSGSPRAGDTYQVLAAGRLRACHDVALVYPSVGGGRRPPLSWTISAPGVPRRLTAVFVDVTRMARAFGLRELYRQLATDLTPLLR